MYKTVNELNKNELDELRNTYFYQLLDEGEEENIESIDDNILFNHYEGIMFVEDDFFCNQ